MKAHYKQDGYGPYTVETFYVAIVHAAVGLYHIDVKITCFLFIEVSVVVSFRGFTAKPQGRQDGFTHLSRSRRDKCVTSLCASSRPSRFCG
jgi:hypothetical protein